MDLQTVEINYLIVSGRIRDGWRLDDGLVNAFNQYPVTGRYPVQFYLIPGWSIDVSFVTIVHRLVTVMTYLYLLLVNILLYC